MSEEIQLTIDGQEVSVLPGTTILEAARQAGIDILAYVTGSVDSVLEAYITGQLAEPNFILPGCWPGARNGFRRCRRRRGKRS